MSTFTLRVLDARCEGQDETWEEDSHSFQFYCTRNLANNLLFSDWISHKRWYWQPSNFIRGSLLLEIMFDFERFRTFQGNWVGHFSANLCEIFQQQFLPEIHWLLSRIWQIFSLKNSKYKILFNEFSDGKILSLSFRSVDGAHAGYLILPKHGLSHHHSLFSLSWVMSPPSICATISSSKVDKNSKQESLYCFVFW